MEHQTIAAIATPAGSGGIGIVKISGCGAMDILEAIFKPSVAKQDPFQSRRLYHGHIVDPDSGRTIDEVLVGVMHKPHTYTREDVVEINAHSGAVVLRAVLEMVLKQGARLAEPGEFTKRAFLNGRIDLTQAEAVIDLINAKTDKSIESAARQLEGRMRDGLDGIRSRLVAVLAAVEAAIDFPEDVGDAVQIGAEADHLQRLVVEPLSGYIDRYESAHILRDGIRMIIIGRPNVGKSSLMNRLIEQDRVIVTEIPGTTRDVVEETVDIEGIPVTIADSAGLHRSHDPVEKIGMRKTRTHMDQSDLILMMVDACSGITDSDREIYEKAEPRKPLVVFNKMDLVPEEKDPEVPDQWEIVEKIKISALHGTGVDRLKEVVAQRVLGSGGVDSALSILPNLRHKIALQKARQAALDAQENLRREMFELAAIELAAGIDALGEIMGETAGPDVLDEIFSRFCIGK